MDAKQIKLSLLILFGLIVLSYGFLIYAQENSASSANILSAPSSDSETNLTKEVAQKISAITADSDADSAVTIDEIKNIVDESLSSQENAFVLPEMTGLELNIKKQDYSKYSAAIAKEKEKEDSINYAAGIFYIFNSNSVEPINSISETPTFFASLADIILPAIATGDTSSLASLTESGKKIFEQLKDMEIPEKLVDTHIKIMQFTQYATNMEALLASQNSDDPLKALSDLSKISGFFESALNFSTEAAQLFKDYIPENDPAMASQLEKYGIAIDLDASATSDTNAATDKNN